MMRRIRTVLSAMLLAAVLSGCWDLKELQDVSYVTAIGFDYQDGEYVVYAQLMDFSAVAKSEGGNRRGLPVWIGVGKGDTIIGSVDDLYRSSPLQLFFGHTNAVIIGENILKDEKKMPRVYEFLTRNYEIRYNAWVYGTREPIDQLLTTTSLFEMAPNVSVLHQPQQIYQQSSLVRPLTIREFRIQRDEPARTALLPSLSFSKHNWRHGNKEHALLIFDGAFAFHPYSYKTFLSNDELTGLPWINPGSMTSLMILTFKGDQQIGLWLGRPKIYIEPRVRKGRAEYYVTAELFAYIGSDITELPEDEIERAAADKVRKEVERLFELSVERGIDLLGLEYSLYLQNNREWKRLKERGANKLTEDSLKKLSVNVRLTRTGKVKERWMMEHR